MYKAGLEAHHAPLIKRIQLQCQLKAAQLVEWRNRWQSHQHPICRVWRVACNRHEIIELAACWWRSTRKLQIGDCGYLVVAP